MDEKTTQDALRVADALATINRHSKPHSQEKAMQDAIDTIRAQAVAITALEAEVERLVLVLSQATELAIDGGWIFDGDHEPSELSKWCTAYLDAKSRAAAPEEQSS